MANVTYAELTEATDVQDDDLLASYRGTGPLKRLPASTLRDYMGEADGFLKLDGSNSPLTGQLQAYAGNVGSPGIAGPGDADTGVYFPSANVMGVAVAGVLSTWWDSTGFNLNKSINYAAVADVASATTTDIGAAASNYVRITGTTAITGLGTAAVGVVRILRFAAVLTLTHNATSLILPGAANITTAAGDMAKFVSEGSGNWRCEWYSRATGYPLNANLVALAGVTSAADKLFYFTGSGAGAVTDFTSVARTLVNQTTQALMRTTGLGLGTAATQNTGTSGANVPLLNGTNTWSGAQTVSVSSTGIEGFIVRATAALATNNSASFTGYPGGAGGRGIYSTALEDATGNNVRLDLYTAGGGSAILAASLSSGRVLTLNGYGAGTLSTNSSGVVSASSDEALKDVLGPFTAGLAQLKAMDRPVLYHWKEEQAAIQEARHGATAAAKALVDAEATLRAAEQAVTEARAAFADADPDDQEAAAVLVAAQVDAENALEGAKNALDTARELKVRMEYIAGLDLAEPYVGWTAQGVQRGLPEAVDTDPAGLLTLSDRTIMAAMFNAILELAAKVEAAQ